jgi:4-amino-4-deoxy-L-arabinose transferase-like glycosyltransferase
VGTLVLITLLAAGLRFYRLPDLPPGLHFDEGFQGVTARTLLEGGPLKIFFEGDMGEEPIAPYVVAAALGLFGYEPWIIRLTSAVVGLLTIPLAWWLGRELGRALGPGNAASGDSPADAGAGQLSRGEGFQAQIVGLGTALILAILYWHLSFSRIGMEPILVPFFATLAFAALLRGLNTGRRFPFGLAGLALGGSLYTYKAGYLVPLVAALFVAYAAAAKRGFLRRHGPGLVVAALVALLVAAPIGLYFATHPADLLHRPASVALLGGEQAPDSPWRAIAGNLPRVLGMFFWRGDENPRSNLPGRPALDPFLALLFLAGLGRALAGFRKPAWALPAIWLAVMVLPTLLTDHAPHFGRAIGSTPVIALLAALGLWVLGCEIWNLEVLRARIRKPRATIALLMAAGLLASGILTARAYFHAWGKSPDLFYAYDVGLTQVASYANSLPEDEGAYVTPTPCDHFTLEFLLRRSCASFDGRAGLVFPPPDRAATTIVLLREDGVTLPALQQYRPDGEVVWTLGDGHGRPYAAAYRLPASASPAPSPARPADVTFGGNARLLGYDAGGEAVAPGETLTVTLYWQSLAPLGEDYTVFTHLSGPGPGAAAHRPGAVSDGTVAASDSPVTGHDGQPGGGRYPTTAWQPGETILDVHVLPIPAGALEGEYQLRAGLYLLATLARLPATDGSGQRLPGDAAPLGSIETRSAGSE